MTEQINYPLSEHWSYADLACSTFTACAPSVLVPKEETKNMLIQLAGIFLDPLTRRVPNLTVVTCWLPTTAQRPLGLADDNPHFKGLAADIMVQNMHARRLLSMLDTTKEWQFEQAFIEGPIGLEHVHVQINPYGEQKNKLVWSAEATKPLPAKLRKPKKS